MKRKIRYLVLFLLFGHKSIYAQEISQLKDYFANSLYNINPAAAGYNGGFISQISYSKNWTGLPGSPECQILSNSIRLGEDEFYDPKMFKTKPIINLSNHASLGVTVFNETEGPLQHTGLMTAYAYHISINDMRLSLGLAAMVTQYHLNTSLFKPLDSDDPDLYTNANSIVPDINAGILLYNRLFYLGLSANGLVNLNKTMDHEQTQPDVVLFGGNKFEINNLLSIEPSLFIWRYGLGTFSMDLNTKFYLYTDHWIILAYHGTGELMAGIGLAIKHGLQLGYTYSIPTNGFSSQIEGSHEISLIMNIADFTRKYNYSW